MTISLPTELIISDKTPRTAVALDTTSGVKQRSSTAREIMLIGQMIAAGTGSVSTPYVILRDTDGETLFGKGSILDFGIKAVFQQFPNAKLNAVAVADAGTKGTTTLTFATTALINCVFQLRIAGIIFNVDVTAADTPTVIATNVAAAINANTSCPVTASPAAGVVTLTAVNGGTVGNGIQLRAQFSSTTTLVGTTATLAGAAIGATVPGAGIVSIAAALAAIVGKRYHEHALLLDDSTSGLLLKAQMDTQSDGEHDFGCHGHQAVNAALSTCTTLALAENGRRMITWSINGSESWTVDIAASCAAAAASEEVANRPLNTIALPGILPPPVEKRWIRTETRNLLDNGCSPLVVMPGETVGILRAVSNGVKNAAGNFDYSTLDIGIMRGLDDIRDNVILMFNSNYPRARWADSDLDGLLPTDVATPAKVTQDILDVLRDAESRGICSGVEGLKSQIVVEKVGTQCQFSIPANIVDGMHEKLGVIVLIRRNVTSV